MSDSPPKAVLLRGFVEAKKAVKNGHLVDVIQSWYDTESGERVLFFQCDLCLGTMKVYNENSYTLGAKALVPQIKVMTDSSCLPDVCPKDPSKFL